MKTRSFVLVVLAGLLWGFSGIFPPLLAERGFTSLQMTAVRGIFSFGCVAVYALVKSPNLFRIRGRALLLCVLAGVSVFGSGFFYFSAIPFIGAPTAVVLMYTAPIYVSLYSAVFFREGFSRGKVLAILLMLLGGAFVSGVFGGFQLHFGGILLGLASGIGYGSYNIVTKIAIRRGVPPLQITLYAFLSMGILALALCRPWEMAEPIANAPVPSVLLLVGLGAVTCAIPYLLYTVGMKGISAATASALSITEPMATTVYSMLIFHTMPDTYSAIGVALILAAVLWLGLCERKRSAPTAAPADAMDA